MSQDYVYPITTSFPGGVFTSAISDRLNALVAEGIPGNTLQNLSSDGVNVTLTFENPLTSPQQLILDGGTTNPCGGLIAKSTEYFSTKIGAMTIVDGTVFQVVSDGIFSAQVDLQYRDGFGNAMNGQGDIDIDTGGIAPITAIGGSFNGSGQFSFTVGPTNMRGGVPITVKSGSLPQISFTVEFN